MKVPWQNSLLIQRVRQNNCPTPKSQCNADNAYSKARGYGRGLCIKNGEGATREQEHGWVLAALPSISLMGHCYCLHTAVNSTMPVCEMITKTKGKHTARTVNGMAGIWDNFFFPRFGWKGEWHSSLSLRIVFHCSPHSTASCRSMLCYGTVRGAAQTPPQHFSFPPWDLYK